MVISYLLINCLLNFRAQSPWLVIWHSVSVAIPFIIYILIYEICTFIYQYVSGRPRLHHYMGYQKGTLIFKADAIIMDFKKIQNYPLQQIKQIELVVNDILYTAKPLPDMPRIVNISNGTRNWVYIDTIDGKSYTYRIRVKDDDNLRYMKTLIPIYADKNLINPEEAEALLSAPPPVYSKIKKAI
jgi:hypothetical protein